MVSSEALLTYNASGHHCKSIPFHCSPLDFWRRQRETYHRLFLQGLMVSSGIWSTCTYKQINTFFNKGINTDGYYFNIWRQKDNQLRKENVLKYKGGNMKHVLKPPKILVWLELKDSEVAMFERWLEGCSQESFHLYLSFYFILVCQHSSSSSKKAVEENYKVKVLRHWPENLELMYVLK